MYLFIYTKKMRHVYTILVGKLEVMTLFRCCVRVILKCIVTKLSMKVWYLFNSLIIGFSDGCFEDGC
jgi:hypothetical protein